MGLGWVVLGGWVAIRAAAGPITVAPEGASPALLDATVVTVAPGLEGSLVVGVTARAEVATRDTAVLWPMAGLRAGTVSRMDPAAFEQVEAATRARVERLGCADLVAETHWRSVPGCTSSDFVPPEPDRGPEAVGSVGLGGRVAPIEIATERIEASELDAWLAQREFAIDPDARVALQPHLDAGHPILTVQLYDELPAGDWIPPVRFVVDPEVSGQLTLPLAAGEPLGAGRQALHVLTGGPSDAATPSLTNYPREYVPDECMLRRGQSAEAWLAEARALFEARAALPTWVLVHAGAAGICDPCTVDPLAPQTLAEVGVAEPGNASRLARIWLEWEAGDLDEDPVVSLAGTPGDADLRFVAHEPDVAAYFPLCGEDAPRAAAACPNVEDPGGCRTGPGRGLGLAALGAVALLLRRRRVGAVLVLAALLGAAPEARAVDADGGPRTEFGGALALVGTDRLVPSGLDHGAPWLLNPYLGIEVRRSVFTWRRGRTVGVLGQLRGTGGRAAPWGAQGQVGFLLLEPTVGIDARHGRFREASPCLFGRYGAEAVLTSVFPGAGSPRVVLSGGLHAGLGAWIGRGPARTGVELRVGVVPRTDAWETRFHPVVGLPGFRFFPGTANLWIVASRATYLL